MFARCLMDFWDIPMRELLKERQYMANVPFVDVDYSLFCKGDTKNQSKLGAAQGQHGDALQG